MKPATTRTKKVMFRMISQPYKSISWILVYRRTFSHFRKWNDWI